MARRDSADRFPVARRHTIVLGKQWRPITFLIAAVARACARGPISRLIGAVLVFALFLPHVAFANSIDAPDVTSQIVALVNQQRAQAGLPSLTVSADLSKSAQNYAQLMASRNTFAHQGPDGSTFISRDEGAGYTGWTFLAENIAAGQPTPNAVMTAWMNSPDHRANILSLSARDVGVGIAFQGGSTYGYYWVQEFGARGGSSVTAHPVVQQQASWTSPQTGHSVVGPWLDYMRAHGNVDVFGLPRTDVIKDPQTGQSVQYFQRIVLEYHPENPPEQRFQRRLLDDILDPGADPPVSPNNAPPGPSTYFPLSPNAPPGLGHFVADYTRTGQPIYFKQFFDSHGGVAVFGYPKEEPKLRNGIWTQRFQAAVMEYHPEFDRAGVVPGTNIALRHFRVQLQLLGDRYISSRGLPYK